MDDNNFVMQNPDELFEKLINQVQACDKQAITEAYEYAKKAHAGQKRKSGEEYITHPLNVALILLDTGLDCASIQAALLHDCVEDTDVTLEQVSEKFGPEVARLVDGVTKLGRIVYDSKEEAQMEDLRKMFVAMARDIRVIIIKLCDRLHNMRTIKHMPEKKQIEKALESMEIYAPLANRLGMQHMKWELEDLSLQILDPVGYAEVMSYIADKEQTLSDFLVSVQKNIKEKLDSVGIKCEISGRVKHVYSIYRKMYGQNLDFSELYDICAMRVIVDDTDICYHVLGYIHDIYKPVPGRFKDYISTPKPNGYQSLHTVVIGREGIPFEVQIRTKAMHEMAEYGVAAHWKYKDGLKGNQNEETFAWIRQLLENQQETEAQDFLSNIKQDLFVDDVFVFTPKGDVVSLPAGSTPIDFAYEIHSAVGNKMVGAKVNNRIVSLDYELQNGDIVQITTSKETGGPKRDWLKIAKTNTARNKIRQWFKKECHDENVAQGKNDLDRELRINFLYSDFYNENNTMQIVKKFHFQSLEELYASIGFGGTPLNRAINKIKDEIGRINRAKEAENIGKPQHVKKTVSTDGVIVDGIDNCLIKFAKCCSPIPGDEIIGFITRNQGVSIHRKDCPNVLASLDNPEEAGKWIKVSWQNSEKHRYSTDIKVEVKTRIGIYVEVLNIFANMKINISQMNVRDEIDGHSVFYLTVDVTGTEQLELAMSRVRKAKGVIDIYRKIGERTE